MKIGILTFHRSINYGAYLQAYALCSRLNQENDIQAEIIDYQMKVDDLHYKKHFPSKRLGYVIHTLRLRNTFSKSINKLPKSKDKLISDDLNAFREFVKGKYDVIIAGSDEIWRNDTYRGFPNPYWLPGELNAKKFTYATSAARCRFDNMPEDKTKALHEILKDFSYIGIRDERTYNELTKLNAVNDILKMNCDPSFVYDFQASAERGRKIITEKLKISKDKKIILFMGRNAKLIDELYQKINGPKEIVTLFTYNKKTVNTPFITPFEWMDLIACADFVISEYFHGVCFSIINNTPFYSVETRSQSSETSKVYDLLKRHDLLDRYHYKYQENCINDIINKINSDSNRNNVDFSQIVSELRNNFNEFLTAIRNVKLEGKN